MRSRSLPILAVTPGDPDGIGPELLWKTLKERQYPHDQVQLLCVGAVEPFKKMGAPLVETSLEQLRGKNFSTTQKKPFVWILPAPTEIPLRSRGKLLAGFQSGWAIEMATLLIHEKIAHAVTTGPISKERLQRGGFIYPGHTEFFAALCSRGSRDGSKLEPTMMLANDKLRVSLVTTHLALNDISRELTRARIRRCITHTKDALQNWWGISNPRIAVCALNPHAGEHGLFGSEEKKTIAPEIRNLQKKFKNSVTLSGPHPADTLFANHIKSENYDAVVCMYHDQGLIPVKLIDFAHTVNVTLGLPIIRTSVDHGVAFDLVGTGKADPSSLQAAIALASRLLHFNARQA